MVQASFLRKLDISRTWERPRFPGGSPGSAGLEVVGKKGIGVAAGSAGETASAGLEVAEKKEIGMVGFAVADSRGRACELEM